jgi:7,8-dihydroneopterin aldolase/epimerase/oxygenase
MFDDRLTTHCNLVEVHVHDLRIAARIGAHPHEVDRRQPLWIAATLTLRSPSTDRLEETVDYGLVVKRAEELAERHIALIETFARELADACMTDAAVLRAEILVKKPGALSNGLAGARVVLERGAGTMVERTASRGIKMSCS